MTLPLDIQKLAADAIASVEDAPRTKVAADNESATRMETEIGQQLKAAAELLRTTDLASVSNEDITSLLKQASVGGTLGGVAGSVGGPVGSAAGLSAGKNLETAKMSSGTLQASLQAPTNPAATAKMASALGTELRSLAGQVRVAGQKAEETRVVKAAHMYNAGIALAHLIGEAQ